MRSIKGRFAKLQSRVHLKSKLNSSFLNALLHFLYIFQALSEMASSSRSIRGSMKTHNGSHTSVDSEADWITEYDHMSFLWVSLTVKGRSFVTRRRPLKHHHMLRTCFRVPTSTFKILLSAAMTTSMRDSIRTRPNIDILREAIEI